MASLIRLALAAGLLSLGCTTPCWPPEYHRMVGDVAFRDAEIDSLCDRDPSEWDRVFRDPRLEPAAQVLSGWTPGQLCSLYARDARSRTRFHEPRRSVLEQLEGLAEAEIEGAWSRAEAAFDAGVPDGALLRARPLDLNPGDNVVQSFLLHHLIALRFARLAGEDGSGSEGRAWRFAVAFEAAALGYLADAFSTGRFLVPKPAGPFLWLSRNREHAIEHFANTGLFVLNSRGEVWQAFGERHAAWFRTPLCRVLEAGQNSVRELLLVRHSSGSRSDPPPYLSRWARSIAGGDPAEDVVGSWLEPAPGSAYYADKRLPSLLSLPMPVSATWRIKTGAPDGLGIRPAIHRPQLREPGYHDPGLSAEERRFLYDKRSMPGWLISDSIAARGPESVIRYDPDVASVRFVQRSGLPPSWAGLLVSAAYGQSQRGIESMPAYGFGIGYGLATDLGLFRGWAVPRAVYSPRYHNRNRQLLSLSVSGSMTSSVERPGFDVEIGYVWGRRSPYTQSGPKIAFGWIPGTLSTGLLYAGLTPRVKFEVVHLETVFWGVHLEINLH